MDVSAALNILKSYPLFDIDTLSGETKRKQLSPDMADEKMIRGYVNAFGGIRLVPKKLIGASPMRLTSETIEIRVTDLRPEYPAQQGLNGMFDTPSPAYQMSRNHDNSNTELYRLMYENAKEEAREYKRKYEDAINDKHKAELELAGKGNGMGEAFGAMVPALAGLMTGGGGAAGVGNVPRTPPAAPALQPIKDQKLGLIINYYNRLATEDKEKVYNLLAKVFTDLSQIDTLLEMLN